MFEFPVFELPELNGELDEAPLPNGELDPVPPLPFVLAGPSVLVPSELPGLEAPCNPACVFNCSILGSYRNSQVW